MMTRDEIVSPVKKMSRSELPRVYQLFDLIKNPNHYCSYFQDFDESIAKSTEKKKFWLTREKEFQRLDHDAWEVLKGKTAPFLAVRNHDGRDWEQLWDILNERLGYIYLLELGCKSIRFISEQNNKQTPEFEGELHGKPVICEVKTINISKKEVEYRIDIKAKSPLASLESKFFDKLESIFKKAKNQLTSHNNTPDTRHIVFVIINFDDSLGEYKKEYYEEIDNYLGDVSLSGIEVVFFNKRNPFHKEVLMKNASVVNEVG